MDNIINNITKNEPIYTIGVAAKLVGCSVQMLRLYEAEGLIIPFKKSSSHRLYSQFDIERLHCIRKMINEEKISIKGIQGILALIPCWAVLKCSEKDRKNCNAFNGYSKPCWLYEHNKSCCSIKECRDCEVYAGFSDCKSIKEKIKELI